MVCLRMQMMLGVLQGFPGRNVIRIALLFQVLCLLPHRVDRLHYPDSDEHKVDKVDVMVEELEPSLTFSFY